MSTARIDNRFPLLSAIPTLIITALLYGCGQTSPELIEPAPLPDGLQSALESWLDENGRPPDTYVAGLFAEHDVVILGEQHRIKHDVEFVASMIPPLYESGVYVFATEFARRSDQPLLDSLIAGPSWDESLARTIIFNQFMAWGFQEYVDILHTAWQVNHDRDETAPAMRVIGMNNTLDMSYFKSEDDWNNKDVWKQVLGGQTEADWATGVLDAVADSQKVLIHCGIHHAFSGYQQPVIRNDAFDRYNDSRMGNVLRDSLGMGVVTVYLHAPWNTKAGYNADHIHPADGMLDAFMLKRDGGPFPVGFNTADCPLAKVAITNAVYMHGYAGVQGSPMGDPGDRGAQQDVGGPGDRIPQGNVTRVSQNDGIFSIADYCDGWIYTKPVSEYEPVTYIDGWINDSNLEQARATAMNPHWRTMSVDELNDGCLSYLADFAKFYGHLK